MTRPYVATKFIPYHGWFWRIECVEGFYDWNGPHRSQRSAAAVGGNALRAIKRAPNSDRARTIMKGKMKTAIAMAEFMGELKDPHERECASAAIAARMEKATRSEKREWLKFRRAMLGA